MSSVVVACTVIALAGGASTVSPGEDASAPDAADGQTTAEAPDEVKGEWPVPAVSAEEMLERAQRLAASALPDDDWRRDVVPLQRAWDLVTWRLIRFNVTPAPLRLPPEQFATLADPGRPHRAALALAVTGEFERARAMALTIPTDRPGCGNANSAWAVRQLELLARLDAIAGHPREVVRLYREAYRERGIAEVGGLPETTWAQFRALAAWALEALGNTDAAIELNAWAREDLNRALLRLHDQDWMDLDGAVELIDTLRAQRERLTPPAPTE